MTKTMDELERYVKKLLDEQQNSLQRLTKRVNVLEPKCKTLTESITALEKKLKN